MASATSTQGTFATTDSPALSSRALVSETAYTCFCVCVPTVLAGRGAKGDESQDLAQHQVGRSFRPVWQVLKFLFASTLRKFSVC